MARLFELQRLKPIPNAFCGGDACMASPAFVFPLVPRVFAVSLLARCHVV